MIIVIIGILIIVGLGYFSNSGDEEGFGLFSKKFWARPQCSDRTDNDNDGFCDYAGCKIKNQELGPDPDCLSEQDDSESPGETSADILCTDTDGGKDYYTQGSVYSEVGPYAPESGEDACLNENLQYTLIDGVHLREVYCNSEEMYKSDVVLCLYGCEYGACLGDPSQQCSDSDNGIDASVKGYVYNTLDASSPKAYDYCTVNAFGRGEEDVKEVYCNPDGMFDTQFVECVGSCVDGRCNQIWMHPNCNAGHSSRGIRNCSLLYDNPNSWEYSLSNIDVYSFFIGNIQGNQEEIQKAVNLFQNHNIEIAVEAGGILNFKGCYAGIGNRSAIESEIPKFQNIYNAGGSIQYVTLDGPLRRALDTYNTEITCGGYFTLDEATDEIVDYMKQVHLQYPNIKFGLITNFPHWGYKNTKSYWANDCGWDCDYKIALEALLEKVESRGEKIYYVHVDNPYDYTTTVAPPGNILTQQEIENRLLELESQVEGHNIRFGIIYNSNSIRDYNGPRGGKYDEPDYDGGHDEVYFQETLDYMDLYDSIEGSPEDYIIESWYDTPLYLITEDQNFTFTNIMKNAIAKILIGS